MRRGALTTEGAEEHRGSQGFTEVKLESKPISKSYSVLQQSPCSRQERDTDGATTLNEFGKKAPDECVPGYVLVLQPKTTTGITRAIFVRHGETIYLTEENS